MITDITSPIEGETSSKAKAPEMESHHQNQPSDLQWKYSVFLNFRGSDVRLDFIDFLYKDLKRADIAAFIDSEGLHVGENIGTELMEAIEHSRIFMPILSKEYASSKWCLRELAHAVNHKHEKQDIFPIFYDMNPRDVKNQNGRYEDAFNEHIKNVKDEIIQNWREALKKVGNLKGLTLENDARW